MTKLPPSPFLSHSAAGSPLQADTAAAFASPREAAAVPVTESPTAKGGSRKSRRRPHKTQQPPPGFDNDHRFVLDEEQFMADIEPMPAFIRAPSMAYLDALMDLAGRA